MQGLWTILGLRGQGLGVSGFEGFWAQRPSDVRFLGCFEDPKP